MGEEVSESVWENTVIGCSWDSLRASLVRVAAAARAQSHACQPLTVGSSCLER
jgi:hypothetical protein